MEKPPPFFTSALIRTVLPIASAKLGQLLTAAEPRLKKRDSRYASRLKKSYRPLCQSFGTKTIAALLIATMVAVAVPQGAEASLGLRRTWKHITEEVHRWFDKDHIEDTVGIIVGVTLVALCIIEPERCTITLVDGTPPPFFGAPSPMASPTDEGRVPHYGGVTQSQSTTGVGLTFHGDGYLDASDRMLPKDMEERSLEMWVRPGYNARVPVIWGGFAPADAYYILIHGSTACSGEWGGGPLEVCGSRNVTDDGLWHHLVLTYSGGDPGEVRLYVDGQLDASLTKTYHTQLSGHLYVGSTVQGSNEYFVGDIDAVTIYPYALTPEEVLELAIAGWPRENTPLLSWGQIGRWSD